MKQQLHQTTQKRLASLDVLRGLDLFLLVFFHPVFYQFCETFDKVSLSPILYQLDHEPWIGFRVWDIIMPLFLFMAGTSMPFSFEKFRNKEKSIVYKKIIKRFCILFFLGMIVQGNLLAFDPGHIYTYVNTLQAIACGYVIASIILLYANFKNQIVCTLSLLVIYTIPMMLFGDYTVDGNFAYKLDLFIMGRFHGDPNYTWIWSSLNFGVTVMLGALSGEIIKRGKENPKNVVKQLLLVGVLLIVAAEIWSLEMPIIKHIWSSSMTLFSGGICFILLGIFFYLVDYKGYNKYLDWLKIYGMNSITAYMLGEVVNFRSIAESLSFGLEPFMGKYYSVWLTFVNFLVLFFILRFMYKHKIFLKI